MNLSVTYTAFFLQGAIAYAIRTGICILLGVEPLMLLLIMAFDAVWGGLAHVSEELWPGGECGGCAA